MRMESTKVDYWRSMKRIRFVEEAIAKAYPDGGMRCPTHLSIGQEASGAAVGLLCRQDDLAVSTHRAHAHYLGKGGDLIRMVAEIHGKVSGCSGGNGGSMHLVDRAVGFVGSTAIVGNTIPIGVGLALSIQLKKTDQISIIYLGDGAVEEGVFYESLNFAAIRNLPVLFICENNLYSVYSPLSVRQPKGRSIAALVEAVGVMSKELDSEDAASFLHGIDNAIEVVRSRQKPFFLEIPAYRWREHCGPEYDNDLGYRSQSEFEARKNRDPMLLLELELLENGALTQEEIKKSTVELNEEIKNAFFEVEKTPYPSPDSWGKHVMASDSP